MYVQCYNIQTVLLCRAQSTSLHLETLILASPIIIEHMNGVGTLGHGGYLREGEREKESYLFFPTPTG